MVFSVFLTMGFDQTWVIYSQSLQIRYTWGISHIKNKGFTQIQPYYLALLLLLVFFSNQTLFISEHCISELGHRAKKLGLHVSGSSPFLFVISLTPLFSFLVSLREGSLCGLTSNIWINSNIDLRAHRDLQKIFPKVCPSSHHLVLFLLSFFFF